VRPPTAGGLTCCAVQINNGKLPITGPFRLAGQILGPADARKDLVLLVRVDPSTCDDADRWQANPLTGVGL
jgi:hypothetical protein